MNNFSYIPLDQQVIDDYIKEFEQSRKVVISKVRFDKGFENSVVALDFMNELMIWSDTSKVNIHHVVFNVACNQLEHYFNHMSDEQYKEIEDIGTIFDVEDAAADFIQDQKDRLAAVAEKIADQEPVKVLVYDSGNDGVFTCSGINFESLLVGLAGGENIFGDLDEKQWVTVSYEEVLARNPDVILIHDYDSPSVEEKIAEIEANPTLSQLDCVKNERFAVITLESVLPGDRMAYAVETMAADFYPNLF